MVFLHEGFLRNRNRSLSGTYFLQQVLQDVFSIHVNPENNIPFDYWDIRSSNFAKKGLHLYAEKAKDFIESSSEPFFLQVNFPDAHFPIQKQVEGRPSVVVEPEDVTQEIPFIGVSSEHIRLNTANYYNCMNRLDESVGMLIEASEKTGKAAPPAGPGP